jgi:hypothetical protein
MAHRMIYPVILRHDDGRAFVIARVSTVTTSAVSRAVKNEWPQVLRHTGESLTFERQPFDPSAGYRHRVTFRAGPWLIEANGERVSHGQS